MEFVTKLAIKILAISFLETVLLLVTYNFVLMSTNFVTNSEMYTTFVYLVSGKVRICLFSDRVPDKLLTSSPTKGLNCH